MGMGHRVCLRRPASCRPPLFRSRAAGANPPHRDNSAPPAFASPCYSLAMIPDHAVSRRSFLAATGAAGLAFGASASTVPVGLELYSVREELIYEFKIRN